MGDLQRVVQLGELLVAQRAKLAEAEAAAAAIKATVLQLEREDLPALMSEIGVREIRLNSGKKITVQEDCEAKISDKNKPAAFRWLLDNGFGGIIKVLVEVQFGKGEHDQAQRVAEALQKKYRNNQVSLEENVHPSTLKAFVKERMTAGDPVPVDLFGVYVYNKAVIKD